MNGWRKVAVGFGALVSGVGLATGASGCFLFTQDKNENDCLHYIGDCGSSTAHCDTDSDCMSPHLCKPNGPGRQASGEPMGCRTDGTDGEAGAGG